MLRHRKTLFKCSIEQKHHKYKNWQWWHVHTVVGSKLWQKLVKKHRVPQVNKSFWPQLHRCGNIALSQLLQPQLYCVALSLQGTRASLCSQTEGHFNTFQCLLCSCVGLLTLYSTSFRLAGQGNKWNNKAGKNYSVGSSCKNLTYELIQQLQFHSVTYTYDALCNGEKKMEISCK